LATALAIHEAAQRIQMPRQPGAAPVLAAIRAFVLIVICQVQCHGLSPTAGWLVGAAVLLGLERFGRHQKDFEFGLVMLMLTALRWLAIDGLNERLAPGWSASASLPLLNWQMALALCIVAAAWWARRIWRR